MKKKFLPLAMLIAIGSMSLASCSEGVSDPITGATGPTGERGEDGVDGINGTDGATWLFGDVAPSEDLGVVGDLYLNTSTYDIYSKTASGWVVIGNIKGDKGETGEKGDAGEAGEDGLDGTDGTDGSQWHIGSTDPVDGETEGKPGDLYLNDVTGDIFTMDESNNWRYIGNLKGDKGDTGEKGDDGEKGETGEAGTDGAAWLTGTGAPSTDLGKDGDLYLDVSTSDVYQKEDGAWTLITNIKGETGADGDKGDTGDAGDPGQAGTDGATWLTGSGAPNNTLGKDGDLYLDTSTSDVYQKEDGTWTLITNIKGETGADGDKGDTGDTGTDGATWLTGSGAPSADLGKVGDLYLDIDTTDVYQKGETGWTKILTLAPGQSEDPSTGTTWLSGAGDPATNVTSPSEGDFYIDTTDYTVFAYVGGQWINIGRFGQEIETPSSTTLGYLSNDLTTDEEFVFENNFTVSTTRQYSLKDINFFDDYGYQLTSTAIDLTDFNIELEYLGLSEEEKTDIANYVKIDPATKEDDGSFGVRLRVKGGNKIPKALKMNLNITWKDGTVISSYPLALNNTGISASVDVTTSANGTVTTSDITSVEAGDTITITMQPNSGYDIDYILVEDSNGETKVSPLLFTYDEVTNQYTYDYVMPDDAVTLTPVFTAGIVTGQVDAIRDKTTSVYHSYTIWGWDSIIKGTTIHASTGGFFNKDREQMTCYLDPSLLTIKVESSFYPERFEMTASNIAIEDDGEITFDVYIKMIEETYTNWTSRNLDVTGYIQGSDTELDAEIYQIMIKK